MQHSSGLELQEQPPVPGLGQHRLEGQRWTSVVPVDRAARVQVGEREVGVVEGRTLGAGEASNTRDEPADLAGVALVARAVDAAQVRFLYPAGL